MGEYMGSGMQRILKMYGTLTAQDQHGKKVIWLWDYANNKARLKTEMTKEEIAASERAKYKQLNVSS